MPTPLGQIRRRAVRDSEIPGQAFRAWSLAGEASVKYCTSILLASMELENRPASLRLARSLVQSESIGAWGDACATAAQSLFRERPDPILHRFITDLTKKRRSESLYNEIQSAVRRLLDQLGYPDVPFSPSWLGVVQFLTFFRNKTRGHGARSAEWESTAADDVSNIVDGFISFMADSSLGFAARRTEGSRRFLLIGDADEALRTTEGDDESTPDDPILVALDHDHHHLVGWSTPLFRPRLDQERYFFLNGAYRDSDGSAEYIEYLTGDIQRIPVPTEILRSTDLPRSKTAGHSELVFSTGIPNNLPRSSDIWVSRPALESHLQKALSRKQHPIVMLHGAGGSGKTALALQLAHALLTRSGPDRFDMILWLSARDLDLLADGMAETRQEVSNLRDMADLFTSLVGDFIEPADTPLDTFARELEEPTWSYLIIADNFETLEDPAEAQRFLADRVLPPNKILITSRLQAPAGGLRIEVGGMERTQADELIVREARERYCEGLIDSSLQTRIYERTEGRPYPIKLAVAQIAAGVSPEQALDKLRSDPSILEALFRRSYELLDEPARYLTLLIGNSEGRVPELLARVAASRRGYSFDSAIEPAVAQALVSHVALPSGEAVYSTPSTARTFLRNEMRLSELVTWVEEDVPFVREYRRFSQDTHSDFGARIAREIAGRIQDSEVDERTDDLVQILEQLAIEKPGIWAVVADVRSAAGEDPDRQIEALRTGLSQRISTPSLWIKWAQIEREQRNVCRVFELISQGIDACSDELDSVMELTDFLLATIAMPELKLRILDCQHERDLALHAGVSVLDQRTLTRGNAHSRLAWLLLNLGLKRRSLSAALEGLKIDPHNQHLRNLLDRLRERHPDLFGDGPPLAAERS